MVVLEYWSIGVLRSDSVHYSITPGLHHSNLQYFRRMLLGRILSSVRYLATVRRAIGMPRLLKISTISLSLSGALPSSFLTRSRIASFTLVLLIDSPLDVW